MLDPVFLPEPLLRLAWSLPVPDLVSRSLRLGVLDLAGLPGAEGETLLLPVPAEEALGLEDWPTLPWISLEAGRSLKKSWKASL